MVVSNFLCAVACTGQGSEPARHTSARGGGGGARRTARMSFRCRRPCGAARHSGCDMALRRGVVGAGADCETASKMQVLVDRDGTTIQALHSPVRAITGKILDLHFQDLSSGCGGLSSVET